MRTNFLMDRLAQSSMNWVTARAAKTMVRWASMESRFRFTRLYSSVVEAIS